MIFKRLSRSFIYLESDGQFPYDDRNDPKWSEDDLHKFWHRPKRYVNGLSQETCRDFGHTAYGIASLINVAETAFLQGINLYAGDH